LRKARAVSFQTPTPGCFLIVLKLGEIFFNLYHSAKRAVKLFFAAAAPEGKIFLD